MRGKGNSAYRQQNHLPLMIVHPAYPGGKVCAAVTSQIDITPTLLALSGADPVALAKTSGDLKGRSFAGLLRTPEKATPDSLRPASLLDTGCEPRTEWP
jgi:arylsulfatase A-like enzyme